MKRSYLSIHLIFTFLVLAGTNPGFSQSIEYRLQTAIDSIYSVHPTAVGIMVHVEVPESDLSWSGASGYSNQEPLTLLEADQPALIASSIKTYVSATILRLVEEGQLDLDQSIGPVLSETTRILFEEDGYDFTAIRIKHLLSHTSGIADYATQEYIDDKDKRPMFRWTRAAQLELAVEVGDPLSEPGEHFSYADANYLLLTEIMEQTTGKPFTEVMKELLKYEELGIANTWFPTLEDKPAETKDLVHQYWGEYEWDSYDLDVSWDLYGGGGIACPTKDIALFIYHFFKGDIVTNDSIKDLIFTYIKTEETEAYPYYLGLSESSYHGLTGYGHGGFWGTVMLYFPELDAAISVYILDRDEGNLRGDVMEALTGILIETVAQPDEDE